MLPHSHTLKDALLQAAAGYLASASDPHLQLSQETCIKLLLANGARLPREAPEAVTEVVWRILQDVTAQALVSGHASRS